MAVMAATLAQSVPVFAYARLSAGIHQVSTIDQTAPQLSSINPPEGRTQWCRVERGPDPRGSSGT